MLPNFLIIGAHKAGTTSLHAYLREHPDVFMTDVQEPSFFALEGQVRVNPDGTLNRPWVQAQGAAFTLEEYEALFSGVTSETAVGEKSPMYLPNPEAPARIHERIPRARLIAVLRDPVERAFSHYRMNVEAGYERASFDDAIAGELAAQPAAPGITRHYVRTGFYAAGIRRYQEWFPAEQLKVFLYDDLVVDTGAVVEEIFRFIGVDPAFRPDTSVRHNAGRPAAGTSRSLRHRALQLGQVGTLRRRGSEVSTAVSPRSRRDLIERYRVDITELQDLIHRDLSSWLTLGARRR